MKIGRVTLYHNNNSSSTHSIVLLKDRGELYSEPYQDENIFEFGWQQFVAATRQEKEHYFATQVLSATRYGHGPELHKKIQEALGLIDRLGWERPDPDSSYVDHASQLISPVAIPTGESDLQWWKEIEQYIINNDDTIVLGGNDNTDEDIWGMRGKEWELSPLSLHAPQGNGYLNASALQGDRFPTTARYDPRGFWTLFRMREGMKIQISLSEKNNTWYPTWPEQVDVKITDYCGEGCRFCYTNSTTKGEHASEEALADFIGICKELQIPEVAIGGGEPTDHPLFDEFITELRAAHISPNFTTRSVSYIQKNRDALAAGEHPSPSFAFSCESHDKAQEFMQIYTQGEPMGYSRTRPSLQVIPAIINESELSKIARLAGESYARLTLLGVKNTGRGHSFTPDPPEMARRKFDAIVREYSPSSYNRHLGVDTAYVQNNGIPDSVVSSIIVPREGVYGMYIDAVKGKMGPSSYGPTEKVNLTPSNCADAFARYQAEALQQ